jgi:predicted TIM-barrel fold metal-dependent hydrolase
MIIDCHTHISCPDQAVDAQQHQKACRDVDACFVLAGCGTDRTQANQQLSEYVSENPKAVGFAVIDPVADSLTRKDLRTVTSDLGLRAVVLYCAEGNFHPAHSRAMRLYEQCEELGLVVFFHNCPPFSQTASLDHARPWLLDEVARTFPGLRFIVGRMGMPFLDQTFCLLAKHANAYADLTINPQKIWQVYNTVLGAYEAAVMDKLLFGSGYPYALPGVCIETLLGFNKMLSDTHLPQVPREKLRSIVERDSLTLLGLT